MQARPIENARGAFEIINALDSPTGRSTFRPVPATTQEVLEFSRAGRVPAPGDSVAIAIDTLAAGTRILIRQLVFEFSHTVLEGHRFAIFRIRKGEPLLSWGLPFGLALRDIEPGEYICNEKILRTLKDRVDFKLPATPNFIDHRLPFHLEQANFTPGKQVCADGPSRTFLGFPRNEKRGVGTRNYIVVIGTSSRTGALARQVSERFAGISSRFPRVHGVVPVAHTEGGGREKPNNLELTLRTLAGFMVNPNVGAVLCVDYGDEVLSNAALKQYLIEHRYPTEGLLHQFLSTGTSYEKTIEQAAGIISEWLPIVNGCRAEAVPVKHLRIGLQCGGSDAFSGVSANPLLGIISRYVVAQGGSANLAETDELIGAESYVLANVRDYATAHAFLAKVERFQQWAARHGHTAEGNPSGGNMYRGLYNIAIKSIGAARKKDPATRLDYVIEFAEPMTTPGFYFMDSPGNDLESIAGQVAAGCNMILFATGNGSITNFPFVPTIKVMTTTRRFELVRNEMDFNAGRYQDGESLEDLGREAFDYTLAVASGERSAGERAGHSQVQLWREWRNREESPLRSEEFEELEVSRDQVELAREILDLRYRRQIALVLPTSLCSGQIALAIAEKLNRKNTRFDRAVALPHTEGCGNSGGESERLFMRTMAGYLAHSFVARALLLEHGCEKTHNDAFRGVLRESGLAESAYAFRSVQLDGGIERVTEKSLAWFEEAQKGDAVLRAPAVVSIALHGSSLPPNIMRAFAMVSTALSQAGAAVIHTFGRGQPIEYGARVHNPGVYRMQTPTDDETEVITGLGATGAELIVVYLPSTTVPGNPVAPTIRIGPSVGMDLIVRDDEPGESVGQRLLRYMLEVRRGAQVVASERLRDIGFQITRGREGISL